jgi:hyperosmotically inducible protein
MKLDRRLIPAVVAGGLLALGLSGCGTYGDTRASAEPQRSAGQTVGDAALTAKVKTAFAADDTVKARNINVDTIRGVVTLTGTVNSAAEKDRAIQIARSISGVLEVKDNLRTAG